MQLRASFVTITTVTVIHHCPPVGGATVTVILSVFSFLSASLSLFPHPLLWSTSYPLSSLSHSTSLPLPLTRARAHTHAHTHTHTHTRTHTRTQIWLNSLALYPY